MKAKSSIIFILILLLGKNAFAQNDPDDPGLILPSEVLEIKDLSVEQVDAGLPDADSIVLEERDFLLPEDVSLEITDPEFSVEIPDLESLPGSGEYTVPFIAEAMLGAGNANTILSRISFYKPGNTPRFKFLFDHELIDGFAGKDAGTGYSRRTDTLFGSILFNLGDLGIESEVTFEDRERGLQGRGDYYSATNRFIDYVNTLTLPLNEKSAVTGNLDLSFSSITLAGGSTPDYNVTYPPTELYFHPALGARGQWGYFTTGLTLDYTYKGVMGTDDYTNHRFLAKNEFKVEFPFWLNMTGHVGYFTATSLPYLIPFELALGGSPGEIFSFEFKGGYKVEENSLKTLYHDFSYIDLPSVPENNRGWYGGGEMGVNLGSVHLLMGAGYSMNSCHYDVDSTPSAQHGLLSLVVEEDLPILSFTGEVKWNLTPAILLSLRNKGDYLFGNTPGLENTLTLEAALTGNEETWGGSLLGELESETGKSFQWPFLSLNGFYKVTDSLKITLEFNDLLYLAERERYEQAPFIAPGFQGILKINFSL